MIDSFNSGHSKVGREGVRGVWRWCVAVVVCAGLRWGVCGGDFGMIAEVWACGGEGECCLDY